MYGDTRDPNFSHLEGTSDDSVDLLQTVLSGLANSQQPRHDRIRHNTKTKKRKNYLVSTNRTSLRN